MLILRVPLTSFSSCVDHSLLRDIARVNRVSREASPPGTRLLGVRVERDRDLVGGEVKLATLAEDPATFDPRGTRLGALAVGEDEHAVPPSPVLRVVGEAGGSLEVGSAAPDPLDVRVGTLLPLDHVLLGDGVVEGKDRDGDPLRQRCKFAEEEGEHRVGDGARLVDGDEELGGVASLLARVDVGVTLVDALHRRGGVAPLQATDEVAEDVAPVDDSGHRLADLLAEVGRDVSPSVCLGIGLPHRTFDCLGDLTLHLLAKFLWDLLPTGVVVHRVQPVLATGAGCTRVGMVVTLAVVAAGLVTGSLLIPRRSLLVTLLFSAFVATVGIFRIILRVTSAGLWLTLSLAVAGAGVLPLLLDLFCLLLEALEVPLGSLGGREGLDELCQGHGILLFLREVSVSRGNREDAGDEATLRKGCGLVLAGDDDRVDGEVGRDVPHLRWGLAAVAQVLEDEVVELVDEDPADLGVGETREEVRVPEQGEIVELLVVCHTCRGEVLRRDLADVPGQLREERRVLEERDEVTVQFEVGVAVAEHRSILPRFD